MGLLSGLAGILSRLSLREEDEDTHSPSSPSLPVRTGNSTHVAILKQDVGVGTGVKAENSDSNDLSRQEPPERPPSIPNKLGREGRSSGLEPEVSVSPVPAVPPVAGGASASTVPPGAPKATAETLPSPSLDQAAPRKSAKSKKTVKSAGFSPAAGGPVGGATAPAASSASASPPSALASGVSIDVSTRNSASSSGSIVFGGSGAGVGSFGKGGQGDTAVVEVPARGPRSDRSGRADDPGGGGGNGGSSDGPNGFVDSGSDGRGERSGLRSPPLESSEVLLPPSSSIPCPSSGLAPRFSSVPGVPDKEGEDEDASEGGVRSRSNSRTPHLSSLSDNDGVPSRPASKTVSGKRKLGKKSNAPRRRQGRDSAEKLKESEFGESGSASASKLSSIDSREQSTGPSLGDRNEEAGVAGETGLFGVKASFFNVENDGGDDNDDAFQELNEGEEVVEVSEDVDNFRLLDVGDAEQSDFVPLVEDSGIAFDTAAPSALTPSFCFGEIVPGANTPATAGELGSSNRFAAGSLEHNIGGKNLATGTQIEFSTPVDHQNHPSLLGSFVPVVTTEDYEGLSRVPVPHMPLTAVGADWPPFADPSVFVPVSEDSVCPGLRQRSNAGEVRVKGPHVKSDRLEKDRLRKQHKRATFSDEKKLQEKEKARLRMARLRKRRKFMQQGMLDIENGTYEQRNPGESARSAKRPIPGGLLLCNQKESNVCPEVADGSPQETPVVHADGYVCTRSPTEVRTNGRSTEFPSVNDTRVSRQSDNDDLGPLYSVLPSIVVEQNVVARISHGEVGERVTLQGLKSTEMNGAHGTLLGPSPDPARVIVLLDSSVDGQTMHVKYDNIILDRDILD